MPVSRSLRRTRRRTRTPPKSPPLWRFFAAAAAIVAVIGAVAFARRGGPPDLRITGKVTGTPTPTAQRPDAASSGAPHAAFLASGSWTMSSLPSCFRERELVRGRLAELRAQFPPASERVPPATVIRSGECILTVGARDIVIARGGDRLQVPPLARLYRADGGLTLVYVHGGRAEIRRY